ncbi:LacI family transcriptional regulator [Allokutzneria sp. A3M-2-11 16]|uniref:LacI family DNA-binding transcriptional regulator n=1 Tax=Allokutzneria sp. A3M-2-11 16 TaxID=2962043 RepID=UPI0020B69E66|nr:LacI family DNA-binding transcriptional regulator [Allokutzneria sp. A3M-2-11 16]MCP3803093.1 LacI family transcriptional regulator [Allokutzneria sp. A3M-2-11 16]
MPTIHDVAREAGVAASTVSRAFSNPRRVNVHTRQHIVAVAERLGYRPNPLARALPSGRTTTIGLLLPDVTNPFFFGIIRGAERQANAAGYTLILMDTEESPEVETHNVERLGRAVDGFVLASSRQSEADIRAAAGRNAVVLINKQVAGVPSVVIDNTEGTRQVVEHLASLGHRSLTYLSGPPASWSNANRWAALRESAGRLGMRVTRIGPFSPTVSGGAAAADAAIGRGATAVVAFNDMLAIGTLRRFAERGWRVPSDISVVGYDDIFGADFCSPPLTTLASPREDCGRTAIDLLLRGGRGEVVLPSHLVVRGSTGFVTG